MIPVMVLLCGRFQFFYSKSTNVCSKKSVRKSENQNLESTLYTFAERFAEVPSTDKKHSFMINIDHQCHELGKSYQKADDIESSHKIKSQNKTKPNKTYGNGSILLLLLPIADAQK